MPEADQDRLGKRLERYGAAKLQAAAMAEYLIEGGGEVFESKDPRERGYDLARCGGWLGFRAFEGLPLGESVRLSMADFCQQPLLCPLCAIRRSAKVVRSYLPKILSLAAADRQRRMYLVTLTLRNGDDLGDRWQRINRGVTTLMRDGGEWRRGRLKHYAAAGCCAAATASFEFKRGRGSGKWHPHCHMLWICDHPAQVDAVKDAWVRLLDGEAERWGQDVQPLRSMAILQAEDLDEQALTEAVSGDLLEVFKYPLKFSGMEPADTWAAFRVLKGRRLLRSWGLLRGLEPDESYLDEPLDDEDRPYVDLLFRWTGEHYTQADVAEMPLHGRGGCEYTGGDL